MSLNRSPGSPTACSGRGQNQRPPETENQCFSMEGHGATAERAGPGVGASRRDRQYIARSLPRRAPLSGPARRGAKLQDPGLRENTGADAPCRGEGQLCPQQLLPEHPARREYPGV